jgi:TRAP-type mannitol/chloroaromatic compound transport system substrate-binding protein
MVGAQIVTVECLRNGPVVAGHAASRRSRAPLPDRSSLQIAGRAPKNARGNVLRASLEARREFMIAPGQDPRQKSSVVSGRKNNMTTKSTKQPLARRRFLKGGALAATAAAGTIAMPNVSRAQTVTWKYQSTWPTKDIFHEFAVDYANKVNEMSGGRLKLDVLPAGAVVPAFQMQDAVIAGSLDGGHGVTAYWYGKHKAYSLFGTPPAFGWDAHSMLAWFYYGGGETLYKELVNDILKLNLIGFLYFPMPTQPLGWFKKEVKSPDDLKNIKYRTVGLSADLFKELGAAVTILPGGEIVPAMDRGLLDAAEFNNPSSDILLGFADVSKYYMVQSYHQAAESFEIIFNKQKAEALPKELQAILRYAAFAATADQFAKAHDRYSKDLEELKKKGVNVVKTPDNVLDAQLKAWDKVIANQSKDEKTGAFFAKVIESQKAWVKRTQAYIAINNVPGAMAYKHFFG